MHISLDSALGRQRRLNSVGESVLQIAPNAAAAYSLRSLTGGDPKVVRVRRSSDNGESDFTVSGVSSSALTSFVNEDVELFSNDFETNTSGFTLNTGGSNVAVRNTSDGFSGSGCLQLNLTSSSNSISTVKTDTYMQDTDGVTYTVSFYAKAISGSANLVVKIGTESSSLQQISFSENGGEWVKHSLTFVNNFGAGGGNRNQRILFAASTNNTTEWRIDDFQIVQTTSNGFVETWYDQSGNSRDSTQATAARQPIIVDAGVFQDGLKFTHTDATNGKILLVPRTAAELGQAFALVYVGKVTESDTSFNNLLGGLRGTQNYATGTTGISIRSSDGSVAFINETGTTSLVKSTSSTSATLNEDFVAFATYEDAAAGPELTFQVDAGNQFFSFGSIYVTTSTKDIGIMNATASNGSYRTQESPTGICREVLVYDTHQGDNRVALVDNINNQYNLF